MDSLQLSLLGIGGATLLAVVAYNQWVSRKSAPRQADAPVPEADEVTVSTVGDDGPIEPVLQDDFSSLPQPERKPVLDALIDVIALIEVDHPVSGDAALAAQHLKFLPQLQDLVLQRDALSRFDLCGGGCRRKGQDHQQQ